VENVSWNDAQEFIKRLNGKEGKTYRLPTEAEWEYACCAGSTSRYCFGDDIGKLSEYAWYDKNSGGRTHPVGTKKPNDWGLYDMHGNVWEWCEDWYSDYSSGKVTNPVGPESGSGRVYRGGGWDDYARGCRSASRDGDVPADRNDGIGFRLSFSRS
jgi:formylglycine-generating enzyme required for sulfatase activity